MDDIIKGLASLFSSPDGQKITIRILSIIATGLGLRISIRWYMHLMTRRSRNYIQNYSNQVVVPTQIIVSMATAYIYRWEILPVGSVLYNGIRVKAQELVFLSFERILAEGVLYGMGSIAVYGISLYLLKKYKIINKG